MINDPRGKIMYLVSGGLVGGVHAGVSGALLLVLQGMCNASASSAFGASRLLSSKVQKVTIEPLLIARC